MAEIDESFIQNKVQSAVNKVVESIELKKVRDIKRQVFTNVAKCYESKTASPAAVAACTGN